MREPFLNGKSATFLKFILPKFLENANYATPPRRHKVATTPQQNFLLQFSDFAPPKKNSNKEEENFVLAFCPDGQAEITQFEVGIDICHFLNEQLFNISFGVLP